MATPKKKPEDKLKTGPASEYNKALGKKICHAIAYSADSLEKVCKDNNFPVPSCIYSWRIDYPEFGEMYANAKRVQADVRAEALQTKAADRSRDFYIDEKGNEKPNPVAVARDRLIIDTEKWTVGKLLPRVYGDNNKDKDDDNSKLTEAFDAIKEIAKKCMKPI